MEKFYHNLSGGINYASTKTTMGANIKNMNWSDAYNVEIYKNQGITRQKGSIKITQIEDKIKRIHPFPEKNCLLIVTKNGNLKKFDLLQNQLTTFEKILEGNDIVFADFLNGVVISSSKDKTFYIDKNFKIHDCNLYSSQNVYCNVLGIYKGRIWAANGSTIYYSALGSYNDFSTENDAGYIRDFFTDTDDIIALMPYKDYLAIYKKEAVYLLSGSSSEDFQITPFANIGALSPRGVINANNRQLFFNYGVFPLSVGELGQVVLGEEISQKIKPEFNNFDSKILNKIIALYYKEKNQLWYFFPYQEDGFQTIWINDCENKAWYKRVIPYKITDAIVMNNKIYTATSDGRILQEDIGSDFDGIAIEFLWKSPFLSLTHENRRKTIDEFYIITDESITNKFKFSVFKNYDELNQDDITEIYSTNFEDLYWTKSEENLNDCWCDENNLSYWPVGIEAFYKTEISESNYCVQICIEGSTKDQNIAIIGFDFKEIYDDD